MGQKAERKKEILLVWAKNKQTENQRIRILKSYVNLFAKIF